MGRSGGRVALVASLLMLLSACGLGPRGSATPSTPASPPWASPTPVLTPVATTVPSLEPGVTPTSGVVVLRVWETPDVIAGDPLPIATVYADGSILYPLDGPSVRSLRPEGLDRLLARVRETGLFSETRDIPPVRPADSGFTSYRVDLVDGGRTISVGSINAWPSDEGRRLIDLATSIVEATWATDPADWVDGDPGLHPYQARSTRLTTELLRVPDGTWGHPAVAVEAIAWPVDTAPGASGDPVDVPGQPERSLRCSIVDGAIEARIRAAMDAARADRGPADDRTTTWDLLAAAPSDVLRVGVHPFLPDETAACGPAGLPEAPAPWPLPFAETWAAARGGSTASDLLTVGVVIYRSGLGGGPVAELLYTTTGDIVILRADPAPAFGADVVRLSTAGIARLDALLDDPSLPAGDLVLPAPDGVDSFTSYALEGRGVWSTLSVTDAGADPRAAAIIRLARLLSDPWSWAGTDGWAPDGARRVTWRPTRIDLVVNVYTGSDTDGLRPASGVDWPFSEGIETAQCSTIDFTEADELVHAFEVAAVPGSGGLLGGEYSVAGRVEGTLIQVSLTPLLPGRDSVCASIGF